MKSRRVVALMFALVFLSSCSNTFVYNQLDWLIPWYVDDYVDLTKGQKQSLKQQLKPLLQWHRKEELVLYLELLDRIERDLAAPLDSAMIQSWVNEGELAGERLEQHMLPLAFELGEQLSDVQMEEFLHNLWEHQEEMEEEYLDRDEQTYVDENRESIEENLQDLFGKLTAEQELVVDSAALSMMRFDDVWLAERKTWLELLQQVLSERQTGWQQVIIDAMADRQRRQDPQYRVAYLHNQQVIMQAIATVLNSRTEKQTALLQRELDEVRRSLKKLIARADYSS
jgi:hypothetical protein